MSGAAVRRGGRGLLPPLATVALALVAWQVAVWAFDVPGYLVPAPTEVADVLASSVGQLWEATVATSAEVVLGFAVSIAAGIPLGALLAESRLLRQALYPLVVITQVVPKLAFGPLLIVWFGFGIMPKLALVFLIAFFPVVIDTFTGIQTAAGEFRELARSVGFGRLATFFKITLPQALPSIFSGLKVAITLAVIGAVVAEFIGAESGLGYLLLVAQGRLETSLLFAALVVLTALGLVFYALVLLAERLLVPWGSDEEG